MYESPPPPIFNEVLAIATFIVFLVSVPSLLLVRALRPARMPWWLVVIAAAALSWILRNLSLYFQEKYERESLTFADPPIHVNLVWAWVPGVLYLALWLIPYGAVCAIRHSRSRGGNR
jgi:hypothetical protein